MAKSKFQQVVAALLIALLAVASVGTLAGATVYGAPAAQEMLESGTVAGVAPANNDPQIWLGLVADTPGGTIKLDIDWNRMDAAVNGLQVYVLTQEQVNSIGDRQLNNNNTAAGNPVSDGSSNQQTLTFKTVGDAKYTIVVSNGSSSDAEFVIKATGGTISDGSGQVIDPTAEETTEADETATDETAEDEATETVTPEADEEDADETPTATATPEVAASDEVTGTETITPTETVEVTTTESSDVMMMEPGVVEAKELKGELPEQDDQHFFGLEPSENNGAVKLSLLAEPQDNAEISRRLNFWVLDAAGLETYRDPSTSESPSNYAIAAGNLDTLTGTSERTANFKASGFGPYTVIVYNNSRVPGTYTLRVDGGILIDDSGQSLTAQMSVSSTVATTSTVTTTSTVSADDTATDDTTTETATREGEPGGTYTVQSGDTLGLIARDIYGQVSVYQAICAFNGIADCNRIEVGDVIRLPTQAEIDAGTTAPATPAPAATPEPVATPEASAEVTTTVEVTDTVAVTDTAAITETTGVTTTETTTATTTAPTDARPRPVA
ncbi:MAG: LysM peptidoglycan-binding domain-containing protein [Caldilineaceae bacterium]|nr:LysM peptidoglycan-binding domain-containing protein [Caldilineaceae bacterium]